MANRPGQHPATVLVATLPDGRRELANPARRWKHALRRARGLSGRQWRKWVREARRAENVAQTRSSRAPDPS